MTKPLSDFSVSLNAFSDAYNKLDKVKMESEYTMKVEKDDSVQVAIKALNEQELAVQQAQLAQLQQNGEYLKQIVQKVGSSGKSSPMMGNNPQESISGPTFETKNKYMDNLRLATMSFEA